MKKETLVEWSQILEDAYLNAKELIRFTLDHPEFSVEEGYEIQEIGLRKAEQRGEKVIGYKMGLVSKAKMQQMGVNDPIYGYLTEKMRVERSLSLKGRIHPKVEPEIVFLLRKDLSGKITEEEAKEACSGICVGLEIIDSRYKDFDFKLPDVVADNCSSSGFVLGETIEDPRTLDFENLGMVLEINGVAKGFGSSAALLGHPIRALCALSETFEKQGKMLPAGSIILAGSPMAAITLEPGMKICARVEHLGEVRLEVKE